MKKPIKIYMGNTLVFISPKTYKKINKLRKKGSIHYAKEPSN
jgi:hypothetical protein